ncbi:hypothetical protein R1sor_014903 [Riccia sorocarpa]|uniref:Uncharacterized protein n=1 Tax=Riccia sorocarpa TaxID=122646 RepID=A0ABD3HGW6_9MARC
MIDECLLYRVFNVKRWLPQAGYCDDRHIWDFEQEESSRLLDDLLSMVNDREYSDMTLPLVASSTLIQVLRHIYAGRSLNSQYRLHVTGKNYVYTEEMLNSVAVGLSNMVTLVMDKPTNMRESEIRPPTLKAILVRMVQILVSDNLSGATISNLSKDAFMFYLENIREEWLSNSSWQWSLEEYRKLTQVLIWCLRTGGSQDVKCLPSTESVARFLRDGDQRELFESSRPGPLSGYPSQVAPKDFEIVLPDTMTNNFSDLVAIVNLTRIHPDVLLTVVKPSRIIDAERLTKILRVQALLDSRCLRTSCLRSAPNLFCRDRSAPYLFCFREWSRIHDRLRTPTTRIDFEHPDRFSGSMLKQETFDAATQMHFYGIYQWAIVPTLRQDGSSIPKEDRRYPGGFQIGFYMRLHGEFSSEDDTALCLSQNPKGWALEISDDAGSAKFYGREVELEPVWVLPTGKRIEVDKEIEVKLSRVDQVSSFSYDGSSISVVLKNLQGGLLYPAVSFRSRLLKVSMIFRGGFDQEVLLTEEGFKRGELYDS